MSASWKQAMPAGPAREESSAFGGLIAGLLKKAKPSKTKATKTKLAQDILTARLAEHAARARIASVKTGVVTIETDSPALFQELEGLRREELLEAFRAAGIPVSAVRARLNTN